MSIKQLQKEIRTLLKEKNAILLAHNYQRPEVQDVADMTGDSLGLSILANKTKAKVIVFCGVHFMAETASILCPKKTVLIPNRDAGCYMADLIDGPALKARKKQLRGAAVVTYVNSTAEVKAESHICCTSANAVAVVRSIEKDRILMAPDRNLAAYTARFVDKEIIPWDGCCNIHDGLTAGHVLRAKARQPKALVVAHPECRPEVIDLADAVRSTTGMLDYCAKSRAEQFLIATENGLLHQLRKRNPAKKFYQVYRNMVCPDMKMTTLEDIVNTLESMSPKVKVPENIRRRALRAVNRMLAVPRD